MISYNRDKLVALENILQEILILDGEYVPRIQCGHLGDNHLSAARSEIASRRGRRKTFAGMEVFSDPAWDILLELFVADVIDVRLSVTAVGLDVGVAPTTVIRWISVLEGYGLVKRVCDLADKRRSWICMTNKSRSIMGKYFLENW